MMTLTKLMQKLFLPIIILLTIVYGGLAFAQDESTDESPDLKSEVLTPQQVQERLSEELLNRAFGWSEMLIIPAKLTLQLGTIGAIYIRNKSSEPRDFRIIKEEPKDAAPDFRSYIRFGPRSFRLDPEQTQIIKLTAKPPPGDVSEWRQRFSVQLLPLVEDREESVEDPEATVLRLRGIYAVSLPVDVIH